MEIAYTIKILRLRGRLSFFCLNIQFSHEVTMVQCNNNLKWYIKLINQKFNVQELIKLYNSYIKLPFQPNSK